jgi:hypothetical protein
MMHSTRISTIMREAKTLQNLPGIGMGFVDMATIHF